MPCSVFAPRHHALLRPQLGSLGRKYTMQQRLQFVSAVQITPGLLISSPSGSPHGVTCVGCVQVCCVSLSRATCADFDLLQDGVQNWPCPRRTVPNTNNSAASPPSNAACCLVSVVSEAATTTASQ
jgi:hypothetical protein